MIATKCQRSDEYAFSYQSVSTNRAGPDDRNSQKWRVLRTPRPSAQECLRLIGA
jgi:hypothetical protein